jgi:hypothetical protein
VLVAHDQSRLIDMQNQSSGENGVRLIELQVSRFNSAINETFLYLIRTDDSIGIGEKLRAQGEKRRGNRYINQKKQHYLTFCEAR